MESQVEAQVDVQVEARVELVHCFLCEFTGGSGIIGLSTLRLWDGLLPGMTLLHPLVPARL